jgi:hypothetical protein
MHANPNFPPRSDELLIVPTRPTQTTLNTRKQGNESKGGYVHYVQPLYNYPKQGKAVLYRSTHEPNSKERTFKKKVPRQT